MRTQLSKNDAAARIADLVAQPHMRGGVSGEKFWLGGGEGLGGLYPLGTGDLEETPLGTRIRVSLGMNPPVYVVEVLLIALLIVWTAAAIFAGLLHEAGILAVSVSWRPYVGLAALVLLLGVIFQGHRLGNRQKAALLGRLRGVTGAELIQD